MYIYFMGQANTFKNKQTDKLFTSIIKYVCTLYEWRVRQPVNKHAILGWSVYRLKATTFRWIFDEHSI